MIPTVWKDHLVIRNRRVNVELALVRTWMGSGDLTWGQSCLLELVMKKAKYLVVEFGVAPLILETVSFKMQHSQNIV